MDSTLNQLEFLQSTLGAATGFLETVTLSDPTQLPEWHPYPLTAPLSGTDVGFRPVVVPCAQYDVTENGVGVRVVGATVDATSPLSLPPSVFVSEGAGGGRRHAYWKLGREVSYSEVEGLRRQLDPLGQPVTYLPLPETTSTKWGGSVEIEPRPTLRAWDLETIKLLEPALQATPLDAAALTWEPDPALVGSGVQFYLASRLGADASTIGGRVARPKYSFDKLITDLIEHPAELTLEEIIWICCRAAGNPYLTLAYDQVWETARHVARIAATFSSFAGGVLRTVQAIRRRAGRPLDRYRDVSQVVLADMEKRGVFLHATNSTYWYIDHESGEPLELGKRNERLQILVNRRYGINASTSEHTNCIEDLITHAGSLPRTAETTTLSHYRDGSQQLWVHFGGREVGVLSEAGLSIEDNGRSGLIFQLPAEADPVVTSSLRTNLPLSWWDEFLPPDYFLSLVGTAPEAASAIMRVWAQFVLFREYAHTRPLLAFLGPIGAGKSVFAERFYALFYGARKNVTTIRSQEDYDTHTSNNPFVVFDNIDRCPGWLPAALETSITPREQDRRKLFTDNTVYHIRCDAIVGLTAHDPTIFREGVIDRLLVLNFRRLDNQERIPASSLIQQVTDRREYFLSGLLSDALRVLRTPRPQYDYREWETAIRVMDFMDLGGWIASALGILPEFKAAITALARRQTSLIIEGEEVLVDALEALRTQDPKQAAEWMNGSELWNALADYAPDRETFTLIYKTPAVLGTKIAGIYTQLRDLMGLELLENQKTGRRHWRMRGKNGSEDETP